MRTAVIVITRKICRSPYHQVGESPIDERSGARTFVTGIPPGRVWGVLAADLLQA